MKYVFLLLLLGCGRKDTEEPVGEVPIAEETSPLPAPTAKPLDNGCTVKEIDDGYVITCGEKTIIVMEPKETPAPAVSPTPSVSPKVIVKEVIIYRHCKHRGKHGK